MEYDLNLLKIFYEVAKQKSITKASATLFISQPAVSQDIKKLEQQLGGKLINRSNKGITLTSGGENFYRHISLMMENLRNCEEEFNNFNNLQVGELKIGISTVLTKLVLLEPLKKFHKDYPKINLSIKNDLTQKLLLDLNLGNLDLVIVSSENEEDSTISKLNHIFVYNPSFYNFGKITIKDLEKMPLILQNSSSITRQQLNKFFIENRLNIVPTMEVVSQELVKTLTECGLGVGYICEKSLDNEKLKKIEIDTKLPITYVNSILPKNQIASIATKTFLKYLK
jgi:DNA-binding transcriptional LysR family regulator